MKYFLFAFVFLLTIETASAQNTPSAVSPNQNNEKPGTTAFGLPVQKSYVAPDVVERAKKKYGRSLYSIEKSSAANCENSYLVGLIRNGKLVMDWMCDDPKLAWQKQKIKPDYLLVAILQ